MSPRAAGPYRDLQRSKLIVPACIPCLKFYKGQRTGALTSSYVKA
jgi:hypothetical protein